MPKSKLIKDCKMKTKVSASNCKIKQELVDSDNFREHYKNTLLTNLENDVATAISNLKRKVEMIHEEIENTQFDEYAVISSKSHDKTIGELRKEYSLSATSKFFDTTSILKHYNSMLSNTAVSASTKKKKQVDDEAGESTRSVSRDRASRSKQKTRMSRSLSRSKLTKNVTIQAPEKETPHNIKKTPMAFGPVTPKVKPNKSVTLLRHPKQGEMAISMQGSPLLVSHVINETCANVNIPMNDGRILSLQPCSSLRRSEVPSFDDETRQQLSQLYENLHKMIKLSNEI